ncbi:BT_3928 family protein [Rhizosphaericola mali]|uniref:DoxX family protein n=1 Tax=Rhizosphaericola mali TaxID=2545455 RepID=A0A5P2G385_9BACT|nr:BT_3928 family protein [Rhizosphaericola mali]QES90266.1 DoxX family protein [Rhizosphaericola mali]
MKRKISTQKNKKGITIIRWIIGLLFIFSGLIKANDPLGLSYKMQEFFEAWGWTGLNDITLALAYLMNIFEVLAGVAVIVGFAMPLFSWLLLLLMIAFGFLTGYATLSGKFKSCGCFGDCLPIPPMASFLKDVLLLILISIVFIYRNKIRPLFKWKPISIVLLLATVVGTVILQQFVLHHLPIRDCLPYKVGNNLLVEMQLPKDARPDSTVITFKYAHNGKTVEFDAEHFPDDFNDSTYEYVDRYDKVVRKGTGLAPINDFVLNTKDGADTTKEVLSNPGKYVMVFTQNFDHWDKAAFNSVLQSAKAKSYPVFVVSPNYKQALSLVPSDVILLGLDAVVVKTAARVNSTYFLMQGANVLEKKSHEDVASFINGF